MYIIAKINNIQINNSFKRLFSKRVIDEFDPTSNSFDWELHNEFLLKHSGDKITEAREFTELMEMGISREAEVLYTNIISIENINSDIHTLDQNIGNFQQIESAFAPTVEELYTQRDILVQNRSLLEQDNEITQNNIELYLELENLGTNIINELMIDDNPIIISVGLILILIKILKKGGNDMSKLKAFIRNVLKPLIKTKERVTSNVTDQKNYYWEDNKDVLLTLGVLTLTLRLIFTKANDKFLSMFGEESDYKNIFIQVFIKYMKEKQKHHQTQSKIFNDAFEKNLTDFDSLENFKEFNINSFMLDQQIPTYQKYKEFENMIMYSKKINIIKGKTNYNEKFKQKTTITKPNGITKDMRKKWGKFMNFIKKL